ncbi:androgen-binding protein homolog [Cricetulus griseus]|uniref:Androgen-binding protein homolog n=1 Tax=Cricetulus griseus TaxID=10029 RepID=A0A9J7GM45_CRIGR|nr:androgen-binding protein homolog [Cricetulus griseus]
MKGTLLLLALLVTGELGFQTTKACGPYFELYTTMVTGDKGVNNALISKFDPTAQERVAYDKLQECYNELGLKGKALDGAVLHEVTVQSPCKEYYAEDTVHKFVEFISNFASLVQ